MKSTIQLPIAMMVATLCLWNVGCCSHEPAAHDVTVSLRGFDDVPSIEVDIVAVNDEEAKYFADSSMTKYFTGNTGYRKTLLNRHTMQFGPNMPKTQTFSQKTSPADWGTVWSGLEKQHATQLFVVAFLPQYSAQADKPGSLDPRRAIAPLDKCLYEDKAQTIKFDLTPAKIGWVPPLKSK